MFYTCHGPETANIATNSVAEPRAAGLMHDSKPSPFGGHKLPRWTHPALNLWDRKGPRNNRTVWRKQPANSQKVASFLNVWGPAKSGVTYLGSRPQPLIATSEGAVDKFASPTLATRGTGVPHPLHKLTTKTTHTHKQANNHNKNTAANKNTHNKKHTHTQRTQQTREHTHTISNMHTNTNTNDQIGQEAIMEAHNHRRTNTQANRQTGKKANRQTNKQANKQTKLS